jgi:hypothetical protein
VFSFVANFENEPKYQREPETTTKTSEGPVGLGTTFRDVVRVMGLRLESTYEIVEYEPSRSLAIKILKGQAPFTARYEFTDVEGRTEPGFSAEVYPTGLLRLIQPLLQSRLQRQFEGNFNRLKEALES